MIIAAVAAANVHHYDRPRASSIVSLSDHDDDEVVRPAKRSKGKHDSSAQAVRDAIRLEQNRMAARKSRLRKKAREGELRENVDHYTKSNESLKGRNDELQLMLDEARAKIAATNHGGNQNNNSTSGSVAAAAVIQSSPAIAVPVQPQTTVIAVDVSPAPVPVTNHLGPAVASPVTNHLCPAMISKAVFPPEEIVSDDNDGCDFIDILLENDDWYDDREAVSSSSIEQQQQQPILNSFIMSPLAASTPMETPSSSTMGAMTMISDEKPKPRQQQPKPRRSKDDKRKQDAARDDRLEKNREAARKARRIKKAQHEKLQQSVSFYTRSNELLKKKNEELQLMILSARSTAQRVAASGEATTTNTSSGDSINQNENPKMVMENHDHNPLATGPCGRRSSISRRSSGVSVSQMNLYDVDDGIIEADPDIEHWVSYLLQ